MCPAFQKDLLFLADALERGTVLLDVHEAAGVRVALNPLLRLRIVGLGALSYRAVSMSIALGGICCHAVHLLSYGLIAVYHIKFGKSRD